MCGGGAVELLAGLYFLITAHKVNHFSRGDKI